MECTTILDPQLNHPRTGQSPGTDRPAVAKATFVQESPPRGCSVAVCLVGDQLLEIIAQDWTYLYRSNYRSNVVCENSTL